MIFMLGDVHGDKVIPGRFGGADIYRHERDGKE